MTEKRWFTLSNGRQVYRSVPTPAQARSDLPTPYFKKDQIDLCQSQADGKWYDSLSELRRTYRADGNPQGKEYVEVGNESGLDQSWSPRQVSDEELNQVIEKAEAQVANGDFPQSVSLSDG